MMNNIVSEFQKVLDFLNSVINGTTDEEAIDLLVNHAVDVISEAEDYLKEKVTGLFIIVYRGKRWQFKEPIYWSNEDGWVSIASASLFTNTNFNLPIDGEWLELTGDIIS